MADIPGSIGGNPTISVGATVTDTLEVAGDHDWFAITLTAGQVYDVLLTGITLQDSYLTIRDSAGNVLFSNDDINPGVNRNSEVKFTASYSGTYYIDVGSYQDSYAGSYQLSVQPYTPPPVATYDQIADQLVSGFWGGDIHHFAVTQGGSITVDIHTLTATEQTLARAALQEWTDIIGVNFREVTSGGQIVFSDQEGTNGPIASTDANWSNGITTSAHIQISTSWVTRYGSTLNSYSFQAYVHEIGHALGLGHAGDYNNSAQYPYDALFLNDAWSTSIMSYFDQTENTYFADQGFTRNYAVTPMGADILAMQRLYGLSTTTRTGDTTYGYNSNAGGVYDANSFPSVAYTIFDSGGNDTLDFSGAVTSQVLNLNPETFSNVNGYTGNLFIARGVIIENAIGGNGADTLTGNSVANVLSGRGGADTLNGGAGDDTLTGGTGLDQLTGGLGNDSFKDTAAGLNGDTLVDFGAGDKIIITDANSASFTFNVSGTTLTYTGGSLTLGSAPSGTIVASAAAGGGVQLALSTGLPPNHPAQNDFNGDGKSDILWRDANSGLVADWLAGSNGAFTSNYAVSAVSVPANWTVVGVADFNGDARADILWRDTSSGMVVDWLANADGSFTSNYAVSAVTIPMNWTVAGTGDFNGDQKADILWRDSSGLLVDWLGQANGSFSSNYANSVVQVPTNWKVVGTGDFNGDGKDDILWRDATSGLLVDWLGQANGGFTSNYANSAVTVPLDWHLQGTGDFNGDGRTDLLWRNDAGLVVDWLANANGSFTSNYAVSAAQVPADWKIADVGDFNADGRDDILWRNDSGQLTEWLANANGSFASNWANVHDLVPTNWHVQAHFETIV